LADAALMRLEAKRAKGPAGLLVPDDGPVAEPPPSAEPREIEIKAGEPEKPRKAERPEKRDDVAARLEAALKGHLENVATALAATRAAAPPKPSEPSPGRSIYAPGSEAARLAEPDLHLPPATPLEMEPLDPPPAPPPSFRDEVEVDEYDEDDAEFGHSPLAWMSGEDDGDDEPIPALIRRPRPEPEPVAHLPPLVEPPQGISARTIAVAALFGLAAGVGAIAAYQFAVAPVASSPVAIAASQPAVDTSKIIKIDSDRVPQAATEAADAAEAPGQVAPVRAAATARPTAPAVAAVDAVTAPPAPAPLAPPKPAEDVAAAEPAADAVPPALRKTGAPEDPVAAADAAPGDTEPFVATASIRPAPPKRPAADPQVLAYAPTPAPNDPVGRSFFGKDDGNDDSAAAKKSASARIPAPSPGKAKVVMAVNMRAKPDNDAPSVKILGAGSRVQVVKCDGWCEVVAGGKRGYIFKKFLDN
jgi:hypothetical protein